MFLVTVLYDPGEFDHRLGPELRCRRGLRRDLSGSALPILPQSVSRGARISGLPGSHICYSLSGCSPPVRIRPERPATGGFYFQAFNGSVSLPVAGYDYNSDWTPLLAGLAPAGMAASLAAPDPYVQLSRIRLPDGPAARRASERAISVHRSDAMLASRRSLVRASSAAFWSFGGPGMLCVESIDISRFCVEATGHHRVTGERRNGGDVGPRGLGEGDRGRHP